MVSKQVRAAYYYALEVVPKTDCDASSLIFSYMLEFPYSSKEEIIEAIVHGK
jgi:hypothetical protein